RGHAWPAAPAGRIPASAAHRAGTRRVRRVGFRRPVRAAGAATRWRPVRWRRIPAGRSGWGTCRVGFNDARGSDDTGQRVKARETDAFGTGRVPAIPGCAGGGNLRNGGTGGAWTQAAGAVDFFAAFFAA